MLLADIEDAAICDLTPEVRGGPACRRAVFGGRWMRGQAAGGGHADARFACDGHRNFSLQISLVNPMDPVA